MKFSEFKNNSEMLAYFGLQVQNEEFINYDTIESIELPSLVKEDIKFALANRGDTDMEAYACEFFILPLLKEAWKRNTKIKLFSHPRIVYEDLILTPDYVVTPRDKVGSLAN